MGERNVLDSILNVCLFVTNVSQAQQVNYSMNQVEKVLFFFYSLKKNYFRLGQLVFNRKVSQGATACYRTELAAYVRNQAAL